jgi:signal transduction histidine kinase
MKRFEDIISPFSWSIFYIGFLPMFIVLFHPSLLEYAVLFGVDYAALTVTRLLDRRMFLWLYPDSVLYFLEGNIPKLAQCTTEDKKALLQSMIRFPSRRALYCGVVSFFKVIPAAFVIVFYWQHSSSNGLQALKFFSVVCVMSFYFYGTIFIENQILVSRKIAEFHKRYDWADAFKTISIPAMREEFGLKEASALFSIWIFMLWLQALLISSDAGREGYPLSLQVGVVGFAGMIMISRVWYLSRRYFIGGLLHLFQALDNFDPEKPMASLPLHSSPVLAQFERVFNALLERLGKYQSELSQWVSYQTEESRYRALGEISALVVHDLSSPLHVIQFCTEEIKKDPGKIEDGRYLEQLSLNGKKSLELVDSLKAYLRGSRETNPQTNFNEALEHVTKLLATQFLKSGLPPVKFELDEKLSQIVIQMTKADFIHVLLNLIKNSYENFAEHGISTPMIAIKVVREAQDSVVISLRDNGSGLSPERFEELTGWGVSRRDSGNREGLGLRLVRRLLERSGGKLEVCPLNPNEAGTDFHIELVKGKLLEGSANE